MPELLSTSKEPLMPKNNVTDLITDQEKERLRRQEQRRQQVLDRLWEIANLSAEMTRGSITGQVKAIQMIVAIEGLIPDPRAGSAKKNSIPHPSPDPVVPEPNPHPTPEADLPPHPVPSEPIAADRSIPSEVPHSFLPLSSSLPDMRVPFRIGGDKGDR
jgi:hypothetical protein